MHPKVLIFTKLTFPNHVSQTQPNYWLMGPVQLNQTKPNLAAIQLVDQTLSEPDPTLVSGRDSTLGFAAGAAKKGSLLGKNKAVAIHPSYLSLISDDRPRRRIRILSSLLLLPPGTYYRVLHG